MDNKRKYEEPLLEVMRFGVEDIITNSNDDWGGEEEFWNTVRNV